MTFHIIIMAIMWLIIVVLIMLSASTLAQEQQEQQEMSISHTTNRNDDIIKIEFLKDINAGSLSTTSSSSWINTAYNPLSTTKFTTLTTTPQGIPYAFFIANDGIHGHEPWISDGTINGTFLLKDIAINNASSSNDYQFPRDDDFKIYNGYTYFRSYTNFIPNKLNNLKYPNQIWRTDGTTDGTILILNNTIIIDNYWEFFQGRLFAIIRIKNGGRGLMSMNALDGSDYQMLNIDDSNDDDSESSVYPTGIVTHHVQGLITVARQPISLGTTATVWSSSDTGTTFQLFFDPITSITTNENIIDDCNSEIILQALPKPFGDQYMALKCFPSNIWWIIPLEVPTNQNPSPSSVLWLPNIKSRYISFTSTIDGKYLIYTPVSETELGVFRTNGTHIEHLFDRMNNTFLVGKPIIKDNNLYYFLRSINNPTTSQGLEDYFIELWVAKNILNNDEQQETTITTERLYKFSGMVLTNEILLSDQSKIMILDNPITKVEFEFWSLRFDKVNDISPSLELIHTINATTSSSTTNNDMNNNNKMPFPAIQYVHLDSNTILFSGYDPDHGWELWKLTYDGSLEQEEEEGAVTTSSSSTSSLCIPFKLTTTMAAVGLVILIGDLIY